MICAFRLGDGSRDRIAGHQPNHDTLLKSDCLLLLRDAATVSLAMGDSVCVCRVFLFSSDGVQFAYNLHVRMVFVNVMGLPRHRLMLVLNECWSRS